MIPYSRQAIDDDDVEAVLQVLSSDYLTQGKRVPRFEQAMSEYCQAEFAVAVNSATSALHVACLALGLARGDWLWTSAMTFVASANCGVYCGAEVDFVDIDAKTGNISVAALEHKLVVARGEKRLPKILVVVHLAGMPAEMQQIRQLADEYGFYVIEDASHALGASYRNRPVGSCDYSEITVFSFHPVKPITSAEGGMALTCDAGLAKRMRLFANHGIERDADRLSIDDAPGWYYEQVMLGYNYRMSDLHAALGLTQLQKLEKFLDKRRAIASSYDQALQHLPVVMPVEATHCSSAWHLFSIRIPAIESSDSRDRVYRYMREQDVGVQVHYIPLYHHPYYSRQGFVPASYPQTENYFNETLSLPCFPGLDKMQQQFVIEKLTEALS